MTGPTTDTSAPTPDATPDAGERVPFGRRLHAAIEARGPMCVGIDPHPGLLAAWGLGDDVEGLTRFSLTVLEALADRVAAFKPQVAFYERFGSRGVAVLERVLAEASAAGALTIADAKRGDIGSTMAAYAEAFAGDGSPLAADAVTASPYLGFGSLRPLLDLAAATGRGVFVLGLTSNPEGPSVQHAVGADGRSVAGVILDGVRAENAPARAAGEPLGSVGAVVGATIGGDVVARLGVDLDVHGPLLAPGLGAQGATAEDLRAVFGSARHTVLPTSSRDILGAGPDVPALRTAYDHTLSGVREALAG